MNSAEIRAQFLDFFKEKGHQIVPSAPMVVQHDPTLMFTNAGMNQFKDIFLGHKPIQVPRIANTQKCLRVSGKHNDLEEVGVDTYHHTMFEMLGNWSFGDYFKKEAIAWAWELLTTVYKLDQDRLYVSVFGGEASDGLEKDEEAAEIWKNYIAPERILYFGKKDNFWEMGDTGPCGPCSEIHVDLRSEAERLLKPGNELVNNDHPQVIEIWNLVFMQYNRLASGQLVELPHKHVDTGMGFERLVRALQTKASNYDTDIFLDTIRFIEQETGITYQGSDAGKADVAMRVMADHIRAISFAISDGQLPSNTGAGYVIRRILRRAVRYAYSYLNADHPLMYKLVSVISAQFEHVFPELYVQREFVSRVIFEEEKTFLHTLAKGIERLSQAMGGEDMKTIEGKLAFELYDTYGFPVDLTCLIAAEKGKLVDMDGFQEELDKQKNRSRKDAEKQSGDWQKFSEDESTVFVGYENLEYQVKITAWKEEKVKDKVHFLLAMDQTPFYAESGGQVGDTGILSGVEDGQIIHILDTRKENDKIIHVADAVPVNPTQYFKAEVQTEKRKNTEANHSATHLLHAALRKVLGTHVAQKGSLVNEKYLRFDFSHYAKMTDEELQKVELMVNEKIRNSIPKKEMGNVPIEEAKKWGAMALFGEKYGDFVRVIQFGEDFSTELCGGTHVQNTAEIGWFKILSESSVAAGVRRIEAVSAGPAFEWLGERLQEIEKSRHLLGTSGRLEDGIKGLLDENVQLKKQIESFKKEKVANLKQQLFHQSEKAGSFSSVMSVIRDTEASIIKDVLFQLRQEVPDLFAVIASEYEGKPAVSVMICDALIEGRQMNASEMVRSLAVHIKGGGGGQAFFATAGGKDAGGLEEVIKEAREKYKL